MGKQQFVLLINGAIGAGKTTLANYLKKKLPPRTAFIDLDNLRVFFNSYERSVYYNNLTRSIMIDLARIYVKNRCNVVIPSSWPIKFQKDLKKKVPSVEFIHIFLENNLKRSIERVRNRRTIDKIKTNHKYYSMQRDDTAIVINSNDDIKTVRRKALSVLKKYIA
jgi:adenylylsulfate kinase-like enzyme